jgi:Lar family restriction alleviation protein
MTEKPAPCPFCASTDIEAVRIDTRQREGQLIAMACCECGCQGPADYVNDAERDEYQAIHWWNCRVYNGVKVEL